VHGGALNCMEAAVDVRIVIAGLGIAGRDHARALEQMPGATVVAAVDPNPSSTLTFRGREVAVYPTVLDAKHHGTDVVVVASPTPTHASVCKEASEHFPAADILVEKPAAADLAEARRVIKDKPKTSVAFHMAFSAEVEWALTIAKAKAPDLGPPIAIESVSSDPYQRCLEYATQRLGNSWIDTGINALSVIDRFARLDHRKSLRQIGPESWSAFEGSFTCLADDRKVTALVLTTWYATDRSRTTRMRYASGAELVMDHNAVSGYLKEHGSVTEIFGTDGSVPRRESHYRALYRSWLPARECIFSPDDAMRLHELLLGPASQMNSASAG
jgi:predicted dehydrogenase